MNTSKTNEVKRAIITAAYNECEGGSIKKEGRFRALIWESEAARLAAQNLALRTMPDKMDDEFWRKYDSHCRAIYTTPNVGAIAGLHNLLKLGAGITIGSNQAYSNAYAYVGVGNGITQTAITTSTMSAGATSCSVAALTLTNNSVVIAAGDIVYFSDGANSEYCTVLTCTATGGAAGTLTLNSATPVRFQHAVSVVIVRAGKPDATDMVGSSKGYRPMESTWPQEGVVSGKATLTWQATYAVADAQWAWNEAIIGAANTTVSGYVTTLPTGVILAAAAWYPSPLTKGATQVTQQYQLSIS